MNLFYKTDYNETMILDYGPTIGEVKILPEPHVVGNKVATPYAIGYMKALLVVASSE